MDFIFLVGGFAESKMLEHRVKQEFERGGRRVIVPLRPGLAVVRGAVLLGLGGSGRFASRLARRTYGVGCANLFNSLNLDHHNRQYFSRLEEGKVVIHVSDCFSKIVAYGESIALEQVHQGQQIAIADDYPRYELILYESKFPDTRWLTDEGVTKIGSIFYSAKAGDIVRVDLVFGATEIHATVVNQTTNESTPAVVGYNIHSMDVSHGASVEAACGGGGGNGEAATVGVAGSAGGAGCPAETTASLNYCSGSIRQSRTGAAWRCSLALKFCLGPGMVL